MQSLKDFGVPGPSTKMVPFSNRFTFILGYQARYGPPSRTLITQRISLPFFVFFFNKKK
jgi:hypothetical protein